MQPKIPGEPADPDVEAVIEQIENIHPYLDGGSKTFMNYTSGNPAGTVIDTDTARQKMRPEAIVPAKKAYDALSEEQKALVTNADFLMEQYAWMLDTENYNVNFKAPADNITIREGAANASWMSTTNLTSEQIAQIPQTSREVFYFVRNSYGYIMGPNHGATVNAATNRGGNLEYQVDGQPSHNPHNPFGTNGRRWSGISNPFAGIAFPIIKGFVTNEFTALSFPYQTADGR